MVSRRANLAPPTVIVSPTFFPSCRRVTAPSSIWSFLDSGWPLVVGGSTAPRCRSTPSTGRVSRPPTGAAWPPRPGRGGGAPPPDQNPPEADPPPPARRRLPRQQPDHGVLTQ